MINLNIEPANFCNARCYYCCLGDHSFSHGEQACFLPLEIHAKLFKELDIFMNDVRCAPVLDKSIYLRYCGVGEPTLHPNFFDMAEVALSFPAVKQLAILSNGYGWNKNAIDIFIKLVEAESAKPVELIFSLDTLNPHTYYKIKKLNSITGINEQLMYLLEQKAKYRLNNLHLIFQMIILDENFNEISEFSQFWIDAITKHGLSWKIVNSPTYPIYFPETDCFIWLKIRDDDSLNQRRYLDLQRAAVSHVETIFKVNNGKDTSCLTNNSNTSPLPPSSNQHVSSVCSLLWYGINIAASGDVSPCCIDVNYDLKIGNLRSNSLSQIYMSDTMKKLRFSHIKNELSEYSICFNCHILYRGIPICTDEIMSYVKATSCFDKR
jgi:radical SAM protein with 4Fe4S-binding SPASM domain